MGLFDDDSLDEQLDTDLWIEDAERDAVRHAAHSAGRDEDAAIQAAIDSGFYTKAEIMDQFFLDEGELDEYDTSLLEDE